MADETETTENQQRGLVIISALLNFIDWLATQGVLVTNVSESRAEVLRGGLVKQFLDSHSAETGYFKQADEIAERLGVPFEKEVGNGTNA